MDYLIIIALIGVAGYLKYKSNQMEKENIRLLIERTDEIINPSSNFLGELIFDTTDSSLLGLFHSRLQQNFEKLNKSYFFELIDSDGYLRFYAKTKVFYGPVYSLELEYRLSDQERMEFQELISQARDEVEQEIANGED
jgi:hypothetical protein